MVAHCASFSLCFNFLIQVYRWEKIKKLSRILQLDKYYMNCSSTMVKAIEVGKTSGFFLGGGRLGRGRLPGMALPDMV